jgi:outer membrane protein assembly factor BamA
MMVSFIRSFFPVIAILLFVLPVFAQDESSDVFEIDDIVIVFIGEQSFPTETIKGIMALKEGDEFESETYKQDIERIKKYYFDNGFFDVKVDTSIIYDYESKELDEKFVINEGFRYRINELDLAGLEDVPAEIMELIRRPGDVKIHDGSYYSKDTVRQEIIRILEILHNNGYALAEASNPEVLKYMTNVPGLRNKMNLTIPFSHGGMYKFGKTKISFRGERYNITLEDITRELTYKEGELYRKEELVKSEINLSKMSILENPRISIADVDSANRIIDFSLDIYVSNKYELVPELFSYYFQNYFYVGAGISLSDKNFIGGGRVLSSALRGYYNSTENYRLEWINTLFQPFLFGNKNTSGSWNIGLKYISEEISSTSTFTNLFSVSHNLPTYTYLNRIVGSWETDYDNITLKKDVLSEDSLLINSFSLNAVNSTLSLALIHNTVNNLQFPFQGNFQSYEFEDSGLMSGLFKQFINAYIFSYFKFSNLNSFYFNLSNREFKVPSALATKFYFGTIFEYGDNTFNFDGQDVSGDKVPSDERFVCGGSSSI